MMTQSQESQNKPRIGSLDLLRGIALLGILLMNIQGFSMPSVAYLNPFAYGDMTGANFWVWATSHVLADQKFMTLFSMLFGAGIIVFSENAERKLGSSAAIHYRRNTLLLIFGLMHGYLLWYGDILFSYAMCGFVVYLLRHKSVKTLLYISGLLFSIPILYNLFIGISLPYIPAETVSQINNHWAPGVERITRDLTAYRGDLSSVFAIRQKETFILETQIFLSLFFWRASSMMLLGMALYKSHFFHLEWNKNTYLKLAIYAGLSGLALILWGLKVNLEAKYSLEFTMFLGTNFNYLGSLLVALSYAALVMLFAGTDSFQNIKRRLATIGQTAFSNYIFHSLICTTLFYGYGFGLFGHLERWQQLLVVIGIWVLQLFISPLWLKRFQFGPLEWAWRCLTYGRIYKLSKV